MTMAITINITINHNHNYDNKTAHICYQQALDYETSLVKMTTKFDYVPLVHFCANQVRISS